MTEVRTLTVHDLTPGCTVSGAHASAYFDPSKFEVYEFSNVGSGWPMMAHHNRHFCLGSIPLELADAESLAESVRELESLLAIVADGYEEHWDGSNHRGTLTEPANEALEQACEAFQDATAGATTFWDAGDWFSPISGEVAEEILAADSLESWAKDAIDCADVENAKLRLSDVLSYGDERLRMAVEEWQGQVDDCEGDLDEDAFKAQENITKAREILRAA
jgi:hypothetical protein